MKTKLKYRLLPIVVILASVMGVGISFTLGGGAFSAFIGIESIYDIVESLVYPLAYILLLVSSVAFCVTKYCRMKKHKEVYTLHDSIVITAICTITIYMVSSLLLYSDFFMLLIVMLHYCIFPLPLISYVICYFWLKKNDKIASSNERAIE